MIDLLGYGAFFLSTALILGAHHAGAEPAMGADRAVQCRHCRVRGHRCLCLGHPDNAGYGWTGSAVSAGPFRSAGWRRWRPVAAAAAAFTGYATLRLKADYLAITTFGVAVVVQLVALNAQGLTGGPFGVAFIPRPFAGLCRSSRSCSTLPIWR